VKQGRFIVGKGVVKSGYKHDPEILKGCKREWEHYRKVDWMLHFQQFELVLGADQHTVLELKEKRLKKIRERENQVSQEIRALEAIEGERHKSETTFRARNRALIEAKKINSDYRCEVCKMSFEEVYGDIGKGHIIAHHIDPIGGRRGPSKTTLDDIALVCANCHDMLHRTAPPQSVSNLRHRIEC